MNGVLLENREHIFFSFLLTCVVIFTTKRSKMMNKLLFYGRHLKLRQMCRPISISKSILDALPQATNTDSAWTELRSELQNDPSRLIVLDDDPTGCQTVYDVNVLLDYSVESIHEQLEKDHKLFYILTNTRSMPPEQAKEVIRTVLGNIDTASAFLEYPHHRQIISRSDSTLRGHFPAETDEMKARLVVDKTIICPAFFEGGRVTLNDTHYVVEGEKCCSL